MKNISRRTFTFGSILSSLAGLLSTEKSESQSPSEQATVPQWKENLCYYDKLVALAFTSTESWDEAAKKLFEPPLKYMPFDLVGNQTVIVPAEAIEFFKGLEFEVQKVSH